MRPLRLVIALVILASLTACAAHPPRWRNEAILSLERARKGRADRLFADEFYSAAQTFRVGEELLKVKDPEAAERYYYLALLKGELLEKNAARERDRLAEEAQRKEAEKKRLEAEESERARDEARRLAAEKEAQRLRAEEEMAASRAKAKEAREKARPLVARYTVKRGESLPLIASRPEVYGDRNLWPLLYRANRDQIRDPRHLWPGQVLRIPRALGRDEIAEARRYAQEKPLR